jgi:hypothetical protein
MRDTRVYQFVMRNGRESMVRVSISVISALIGALAIGFWFFSIHTSSEAHPGVTIITVPLHAANIPAKSQSQNNELGVEALVLTPMGFDRTEITRPRGKFLLVVKSRLGLYEPSLELSRLIDDRSMEKLKAGVLKKEQQNWVEELDLQPGEYVVNEASKSGWSCRLRITQ